MMAIVSIFPVGKGESLTPYIAEALREVRRSGLDYRLTAMGTILEGEWDEVMKTIKRMRDRVARRSPRIYMTLSIDDRKGRTRRIDSKVRSVEQALLKARGK